MIVLYLVTWLVFGIFGIKNDRAAVAVVALMTFILIAGLYFVGKEDYWFNTALCFPAGMIWSLYKDRIDKALKRRAVYWTSLVAAFALFVGLYLLRRFTAAYLLCAVIFCVVVVLITVKISFGSPVLKWMGDHLFEIYIIQRFPMILLIKLGIDEPFTSRLCLWY